MPKYRNIIWYHPDLIENARELRNNPTEAEKLLWQRLKGRQMKVYDFHRQKPLLYYIVDFYCHELNLAIEVDGSVHEEEDMQYRDCLRQDELVDCGVCILRFSNKAVLFEMNKVTKEIEQWIDRVEVEIHTSKPPLKRRLS